MSQIGQYQSILTSTKQGPVPGALSDLMTNVVLEFGTTGTVTISGITRLIPGTTSPAPGELTITGGTGAYVGATGSMTIYQDPPVLRTLNLYLPNNL